MKKDSLNTVISIFLLTIIFAVFWARGILLLDPDFGFHLRMGNLIISQGIPERDPFSYTMSSFPSIDHEWLTDVVIAKLYPIIGRIGLALSSALVVLSALVIASLNSLSRKSPKEPGLWRGSIVPFLSGAAILLPYSGIRPQIESWLLLAILLVIILNETLWKKWRFILPPLFILWVNLHGSFAAGLATLFLVLILRAIRLRQLKVIDVIIGALSLVATFVNPYGPRIWHEVWLSVSDTSLRWTIMEWKPALFSFNMPLLVLITFSLLLLWRYQRKFFWEEKGLYLLFLIQGLFSTRHIPLWVVVTVPIVTLSLRYFYKGLKLIPYGVERFDKTYAFALIGCLAIFILQSLLSLNSASFLSEETFYPSKAVQYLQGRLPKGEIFSSYGWGGYLIWKLPEKKVFIDGRMPSWRWNANVAGESNYAMKDYIDLLNGEVSSKEIFAKYKVDTVLWSVPQPETLLGQLDKRLDNFLTRFGRKSHNFNLLEELTKDGWDKVYEDKVAVIYQKLD